MPQRPPNQPQQQTPGKPSSRIAPGQPVITAASQGDNLKNFPTFTGNKVTAAQILAVTVNNPASTGGGPTPPSETLAGDVVGPPGANTIQSLMGVPFLGSPAAGQAWYIGPGGQYVPVTLFLNPMTTAGDMIVGGSGGAPTRVPIGSNTYVWTSNGTTASWAAVSSSLGIIDHIVTDSGEVVVDDLTGNVVYV
jgi:hypothetical protein